MPTAQANALFSIRLVVTFGAVATVAVVAVTAAYVFAADPYRNALIFFIAATAAAGQLGAALYTARILQVTIDAQDKTLRDLVDKEARVEKRILDDAAAKFGERYVHPSMSASRKVCVEIIDSKSKPQEIMDLLKSDKEKDVQVSNMLNFLEEIAVSIKRDRCNDDFAKDLFRGIVIHIWQATEPWIRSEQSRLGPRVWAELEVLYTSWK